MELYKRHFCGRNTEIGYLKPLDHLTCIWSCGVVVITSALHAEGRRFEPGQDQSFCATFGVYPASHMNGNSCSITKQPRRTFETHSTLAMFLVAILLSFLLESTGALLCHKFMYDSQKGLQSNVTVESSLGNDPYCIAVHDGEKNQMFFGPEESTDFCRSSSSSPSGATFSSCDRCNWDFCDLDYMPENVRTLAKKASEGFLQRPAFSGLGQNPFSNLGSFPPSFHAGGLQQHQGPFGSQRVPLSQLHSFQVPTSGLGIEGAIYPKNSFDYAGRQGGYPEGQDLPRNHIPLPVNPLETAGNTQPGHSEKTFDVHKNQPSNMQQNDNSYPDFPNRYAPSPPAPHFDRRYPISGAYSKSSREMFRSALLVPALVIAFTFL
uniref:Transmembrane protein n=1 Tax=Steinernema glaseri TaxID=37863 RepID=A0A1I8AWR4_9BILA